VKQLQRVQDLCHTMIDTTLSTFDDPLGNGSQGKMVYPELDRYKASV
jgi:hypothetical protein